MLRCGAVDRVRTKGPYGFEIDFEIRARTTKCANFGKKLGFPFKLCGRHPTV